MTRTHTPHQSERAGGQHLVRPRRVWGGLGLALLGAVVLGLGVSLTSWAWSVPGVVLLLAGGVLGAAGGGLYDVRSGSVSTELEDVRRGEVHEGVAPGEMVEDPQAQQKSHDLDRQREELIRRTHEAPRPPLAPMGAAVALLVAVFLLVAQWELYPIGKLPQTNANWSLGFAVLAGLAALRLLGAQRGRHPLAALLVVASGAGLLLRAFLASHETGSTTAAEATCGVLLVLSGLAAATSPDRESSPVE